MKSWNRSARQLVDQEVQRHLFSLLPPQIVSQQIPESAAQIRFAPLRSGPAKLVDREFLHPLDRPALDPREVAQLPSNHIEEIIEIVPLAQQPMGFRQRFGFFPSDQCV